MAGISFLYPKFLILLVLVPIFVLIYFFSFIYNKKKSMLFSNFEAMERFFGLEFFSKNFLALYAYLAILVLLVFSVSGLNVSFYADTSSYSYVVAIDNSESMTSTDILPNRLGAAKNSANNFIDALPVGVDVGIIGFSGDAVVMQDMTNSKVLLSFAIDSIEEGTVSGTNVYNSLIAANKILDGRSMKSVILVSDGQFNVGDAPQIISYAQRNNLVIHTVGVGTSEGGVTELNTLSTLDEDFLQSLAFNSGGSYFRAEDFNELDESFSSILATSNLEVTVDLSLYFLVAAIVLLSISWAFYCLRFKVFP